MPPRMRLRPLVGGISTAQNRVVSSQPFACLFCLSRALSQRVQTKTTLTRAPQSRRLSTDPTTTASHARADLEEALLDLNKHAANYVNLSRLQLALQGLRQHPGQESVRVAILGLSDGASSGRKAAALLRTLLADPLKEEEEWEKELADHDPGTPLVVRIGPEKISTTGTLSISKASLLHELDVSSPVFNDHQLEILLMEVNPFTGAAGAISMQEAEDAVLVPTVDIESSPGRYTPITTPVHKALIVGEGIMGAASITALPLLQSEDTVLAAVDLSGYTPPESESCPFQPVDISKATEGLMLFRQSLNNAMEYEHLWFQSNIPRLLDWLKSGVQSGSDHTKPTVLKLVHSLLQNTLAEIQAEEARQLSSALFATTVASSKDALGKALDTWAQKAHAELNGELDLAFSGRRWRKLGWWKLFWRVDDVPTLTAEMLSQRFLPTAEQELIYLAGRIEESAFTTQDNSVVYTQPSFVTDTLSSETRSLATEGSLSEAPKPDPKWPTHISFTRRYLQAETVPALQALAQRLVTQALGTSAMATSLAALIYVSSYASNLYEAGAVAALGIVWSLRRLQKRWETARGFWEGEVREEGRKAVRAVEHSVAGVLAGTSDARPESQVDELRKARSILTRAEDALSRLK